MKELTKLRTLNLQGNGSSDTDIKELDHALPEGILTFLMKKSAENICKGSSNKNIEK